MGRQTYTKNHTGNYSEGYTVNEGFAAISLDAALELAGKLNIELEDSESTILKSVEVGRKLPIFKRVELIKTSVEMKQRPEVIANPKLLFSKKANQYIRLLETAERYLIERSLENKEITAEKFVEFTGKNCPICKGHTRLVTDGDSYQVQCDNCENKNAPMPTPKLALSTWVKFRDYQNYLLNP